MKNKGLLILLGIVAILFMWGCNGYNNLVNYEEDLNKSWNNVEVQYQRRADLIPNIVEMAIQYGKFEKGTLTEITAMRASVGKAQETIKDKGASIENKMAAYGQMESTLSRLMVIVENYPDLKAIQSFTNAQVEITGTENRVGTARSDFNQAVADFNKKVRKFPSNVLAGMFGFKTREGFKAEAGSEKAPDVKEMFNNN